MSTASVSFKSVVCVAGGRAILDIEALTINAGERVAIVGHNGAGKSTLLKLINGFMQPARGKVEVLGRTLLTAPTPIELRALRKEVGQVLQGLHLVSRLSALDNVLIGCLGRVTGWRSWTRCFASEEVDQARAALHAVGLLPRAQIRVDKLSGGERQKVAIARLLVQRPRLILADEPTAALDPSAAAEVCRLLVKAAHDATLITVVHNPSLLPLLADRVIGLKQGRITFDLAVAAVDDRELINLYGAGFSAPHPRWQHPLPENSTRADAVYS